MSKFAKQLHKGINFVENFTLFYHFFTSLFSLVLATSAQFVIFVTINQPQQKIF
jgi:hypothetical protein